MSTLFGTIIIQDTFMMYTKGRLSWINLKGWLKKARLGDCANAEYGSLPLEVPYRSWHSSTPRGSSIRKRRKTQEEAHTEISSTYSFVPILPRHCSVPPLLH